MQKFYGQTKIDTTIHVHQATSLMLRASSVQTVSLCHPRLGSPWLLLDNGLSLSVPTRVAGQINGRNKHLRWLQLHDQIQRSAPFHDD